MGERETEPEYRESATRERLRGLRRRAKTRRFEGAREQFPHAPTMKDARCSLGSICFLSSFLQPLAVSSTLTAAGRRVTHKHGRIIHLSTSICDHTVNSPHHHHQPPPPPCSRYRFIKIITLGEIWWEALMRQAAFRSGVFEEFTRQRVTDWILETAPIWLPSGLQHLSAAGGGRVLGAPTPP